MLLDYLAIFGLLLILTFPITVYIFVRWGFGESGYHRRRRKKF